jgi:hypothetical protein
MSSLRSSLIRLAHQKPALRPHLLPILKSAELHSGKYDPYALLSGSGKYMEEIDAEIRKEEPGESSTDEEYRAWEQKLEAHRESVNRLTKELDDGIEELSMAVANEAYNRVSSFLAKYRPYLSKTSREVFIRTLLDQIDEEMTGVKKLGR